MCKHFIASCCTNVDYAEVKVVAQVDGHGIPPELNKFEMVYHRVPDRGFLDVLPHKGAFLRDPNR